MFVLPGVFACDSHVVSKCSIAGGAIAEPRDSLATLYQTHAFAMHIEVLFPFNMNIQIYIKCEIVFCIQV